MTTREDTVNMTTVQVHKDVMKKIRKLQVELEYADKPRPTQSELVEKGLEMVEKEIRKELEG